MKIFKKLFFVLITILICLSGASAQGLQKKVTIRWQGVRTIQGIDYKPVDALCADGLTNSPSRNFTPVYSEKFTLPKQISSCDILITNTEWETVDEQQLGRITFPIQFSDTLSYSVETGTERGKTNAFLQILPFVKNPSGGLMRLKSFVIDIVYIPSGETRELKKTTTYASHSLLAQGNWYKVKLNKTGVYKITYAEMQAMGVNMASVTPSNIRLFGSGGGMLPESNSVARPDDLFENAIQVIAADQGVFAPGDYILFYGTSPDKIVYNKTAKKFEHQKNLYSDFTYYFLNFESGPGLRIGDQPQSSQTPSYTCEGFFDCVFYENDLTNFINSGKQWVGERMDATAKIFELPEFSFPNLKVGKQAWIRHRLTARSASLTNYTVTVNGKTVSSPALSAISNYLYATERIEIKSFVPESDKLNVAYKYEGEGTSIGWLDWVELNVQRDLKFTGGQMAFADPISTGVGIVSDFHLTGSSSLVTVWEVTDPLAVKRVIADQQGELTRFVLNTDTLRQFIAWDNTAFLSTTFTEKVANQDLHGIAATDMLIVTHNDFVAQANQLAEFHRTKDGMTVEVVTNEQVYNEFSSGAPDIAAIRDFCRMLYQRPAEGSKLRYLLLFGDGSFDFKDRVPQNTNKVLTFQTRESLDAVFSFSCDDFYGMLDEVEGYEATGFIDIGIGRFPVSTVAQAVVATNKTIFYGSNELASMGDWRNKLCFIADDEDSNTHISQVEDQVFPLVHQKAPVYNIDKIYLDAYKQVSTTSGQRYPDVNTAINQNVENGVLVMNYTGHGGETGWAEEGILSVREINAWTNYSHMPVFMTATCEFSRFDDPARVSAGEHVFLNPLGGGVALFTTTRLANAGTNIGLTLYFYDTLFTKNTGEYPRFGDVISFAKNQFTGNDALLIRNFVLLGDPALQLAYPKYNVETISINGMPVGQLADTISAMSPVEIEGMVTDGNGNKLTGFEGVVDVKIFDKSRDLNTLGNDPGSYVRDYSVQENIIYQGRASVKQGEFKVQFIVPRDIDYSFGQGKISYYAFTNEGYPDANGYCDQFIIGGSGSEGTDNQGPEIELFIDNTNFKDGGVTGRFPYLIANLSDESGINTLGNGIGHDIVATLDGNTSTSVVLNNAYLSDMDSYRSGSIGYGLAELTEGPHSLSLKAWDVFNNSSEATIEFIVKDMQISITKIAVYPNPFTAEVKAEFEANAYNTPLEVTIEVFDINGSLVRKLDNELIMTQMFKAGPFSWDGKNNSGSTVVPGIYLLSFRVSDGKSETVKATRLVKIL